MEQKWAQRTGEQPCALLACFAPCRPLLAQAQAVLVQPAEALRNT